MLQQYEPDDYVLSTGVSHTIRYLVEHAFSLIDMKITWLKNVYDHTETGFDQYENIRVRTDTKYIRPNEVEDLRGDFSKIYKKIGWFPKIDFRSLIEEMLNHYKLSSSNSQLELERKISNT